MNQVSLLNPPKTSQACLLMLAVVREARERVEHELTHTRLEYEAYLGRLAVAVALREAEDTMTNIYRRHFEV